MWQRRQYPFLLKHNIFVLPLTNTTLWLFMVSLKSLECMNGKWDSHQLQNVDMKEALHGANYCGWVPQPIPYASVNINRDRGAPTVDVPGQSTPALLQQRWRIRVIVYPSKPMQLELVLEFLPLEWAWGMLSSGSLHGQESTTTTEQKGVTDPKIVVITFWNLLI